MDRNSVKKDLWNLHSLSNNSDGLYILLFVVFSSAEWFGTEFRELASIFVHGTEFRVVFSSAEGFGRNSESLLLFLFNGTEWNGILRCFLCRRRVRNGIPKAFCPAEQPEIRQKQPFVPSSPDLFFCQE
jgi:hypothetical protein